MCVDPFRNRQVFSFRTVWAVPPEALAEWMGQQGAAHLDRSKK